MQNIRLLKITDTGNVYPQLIKRMSSDKNKNFCTKDPCDLQIISPKKRGESGNLKLPLLVLKPPF